MTAMRERIEGQIPLFTFKAVLVTCVTRLVRIRTSWLRQCGAD